MTDHRPIWSRRRATGARLAAAALAIAAAAACGSPHALDARAPGRLAAAEPPAPRLEPVAVPGTVWAMPRLPWRAPGQPGYIAISGDYALLANVSGGFARIDLRTGRIQREGRLEGVALWDLIALRGGGWLAVGTSDQMAIAFAIDRDTLTATRVVAGEHDRVPRGHRIGVSAGAVELADGVVISGPGLPLAVYDPATWHARRMIDPSVQWTKVRGGGTILYVDGEQGTQRFDLAAGSHDKAPWPLGAGAGYTADHDRKGFSITPTGHPAIPVTAEWPAAIDEAGQRFAVRDGAQVRVHALPDGKRIASYDLGESATGRDHELAFAGRRLVIWTGSIVRAIDLDTGAISPAGPPPYDEGWHLAIADDGTVVHLGLRAVRIARGAITASATLGPFRGVLPNPADTVHYATTTDVRRDHRVDLFALGQPGPVQTWKLDDRASTGWLGSDGSAVVITYHPDQQPWRLLGPGAASAQRVAQLGRRIHGGASIDDVDVDAQLAVISREAATHLVDLAGGPAKAVFPHPYCSKQGGAGLERGGDRLYVRDGRAVGVYLRSTGALVGSARLAADGAIAFVPGHDELLIGGKGDAIALWNARTGEERVVPGLTGLANVQVAPSGKLAALAFADGRITEIDLDALRAAVAPQPAHALGMPRRCDTRDPYELEPE